MLRAVVWTQYRRVTDRQTDGRADGRNCRIASTALAMQALRRAVKTTNNSVLYEKARSQVTKKVFV